MLFPSFLEKPQPYPSVPPYPCPAAVPPHPVWSPGNSVSPAGGLLWRPPYAEIALWQGGCPVSPLRPRGYGQRLRGQGKAQFGDSGHPPLNLLCGVKVDHGGKSQRVLSWVRSELLLVSAPPELPSGPLTLAQVRERVPS